MHVAGVELLPDAHGHGHGGERRLQELAAPAQECLAFEREQTFVDAHARAAASRQKHAYEHRFCLFGPHRHALESTPCRALPVASVGHMMPPVPVWARQSRGGGDRARYKR